MNLDAQLKLGHLLFKERNCRTCRQQKNLIEDFYKIRKGSGISSYSYECKKCTINRVVLSRIPTTLFDKWEYPDW
jgi:hypothetical protein